MKICYRCKCSKDETEFSTHRRSPGGLRRACRSCASEENRENYLRNQEKRQDAARIRVAEWRSRPGNAEKNRENALAWYRENGEIARRHAAEWRAANPERKKEADRNWRAANPERVAAYIRAYKKRRARATPAWANEFFLAEAYELAARRTAATGVCWEVDHLVPLQGRAVCGLHVENNIAVIPQSINCAKSNRRWPDMP